MDWVNTGANVLQTAQAVEIKGHLATLAKTEAQREQRVSFHRLCREFLIDMDGKIDDLMESTGHSPKSTYAAARMLQQRFEQEQFTPSLFDEWGDIDRAKATLKKLSNILTETGARVGEGFRNEVTGCMDIPERLRSLDELISLVEQRESLTKLEAELQVAEQELAKVPVPGGVIAIQFFGVLLLMGGAAVAFYAIVWVGLAMFLLLLGGVFCYNAKRPGWGVTANSEYHQFNQRIAEQRSTLTKTRERVAASVQRVSDISRVLSCEGTSNELVEIKAQLQRRLDALFTSDDEAKALHPISQP